MQLLSLLVACLALPLVHAHIAMVDPVPLGHQANPHVSGSGTDYDINSPLSPSSPASLTYPCKLYHNDASRGAGKSVSNWPAGSRQTFRLEGSAVHGGGSCQASFSVDGGQTFKVVKSWIGGCPDPAKMSFDFGVPAELPNGDALFSWTWFNYMGNREMYMSCAVVTITDSKSSPAAFNSNPKFPDIFKANLGKDYPCKTKGNTNVIFPNPGAEVETATNGNVNEPGVVGYEGDCGRAVGGGSGGAGLPGGLKANVDPNGRPRGEITQRPNSDVSINPVEQPSGYSTAIPSVTISTHTTRITTVTYTTMTVNPVPEPTKTYDVEPIMTGGAGIEKEDKEMTLWCYDRSMAGENRKLISTIVVTSTKTLEPSGLGYPYRRRPRRH